MPTATRRSLDLAAIAALVGVVWLSYRFVPEAFHGAGRVALLLLGLALISIAFAGWGGLLLRRLGAGEAVSPAAAWAAGAVLTATVAGWLAPFWFPDLKLWAPWLAAGLLLAWRGRGARGWRAALPADPLLLLAAPFGCVALLLALAPPTSLDALVYHLTVPKQFALAGYGYPMPWNLHAFFPLHAEMLYGLCLALDPSGRLAQLLHLAAALATLAAAIELGRRHLGARAGVWAALVLASLPVLALVAGWAWSDWFVLLYLTLALDGLLTLRAGSGRGAVTLLLFLPAAAAVKYNALPLLALPALALRRLGARRLALGAGLALALLGPWYGRNLLATGNPVYPLLSRSPRVESLVDFRGAEGGLGKWVGYLGRPDLIDESLGALLAAALVPGLIWAFGKRRRIWPLAFVGGAYLGVALVHHPTVRAFSPLLLVLALLAGGGLDAVWSRGRRRWLGAVLALLLWINFAQVLWMLREHRPSGVALGYERTESYLERQLDIYPALRWINHNSPSTAGVLVAGESRVFHLERLAVAGSYLDPHPLSGFLRPGEELPALVRRLRAAGIELLLLNANGYRVGARDQRDELLFYAEPQTDRVFRALIAASGEPLFAEAGIGVWRLPPPSEASGAR